VTGTPSRRKAIVLADGDRASRAALDAAWPGWLDGASLVVAADGGARLAADLGLPIDLWVGDGDSIGSAELERLRASGIRMIVALTDKDESDTELAVLGAVERGATEIVVLGALGGRRLDHALANIGLLGHAALRGRTVRLVDAVTSVSLVDAPDGTGAAVHCPLPGRVGDLVSLLPLSGRVEGITTEGLRYALDDEDLEAGPARGLSNIREVEEAAVVVRRGRLLIVESPATLRR
jgi:thiamine pyrophosphokinase